MKITEEIHQVGGGGLTAPQDAAIYLVNYGAHAALIDAGCGPGEQRLLANIRAAGVDPATIEFLLITHCHYDHTGGADALRKRLGCTVVAHALDAPYLERGDDRVTGAAWYGANLAPFKVDRTLDGATEDIKLGGRTITAVHIPGHSPGSVAYLTSSEDKRVVFAQDVHGPLDHSLLSNSADYFASLQRLLDMDADILCEGHFGVYRGKEAVRDFVRSFLPNS